MKPAGRGRRMRALALAALLAFGVAPDSLPGQGVAGGRVLRPTPPDTAPVAGVRVVLHRVGAATQGPVDSAPTGQGGRFGFRFAPDTGAIYLLSARYQGIEYFSRPLQPDAALVDTTVTLLVYDTSSTAPIGLAARHVVVPRAGDDGGREVIDLIVLRNEGHLTRVARDTASPSLVLPLPPGSEELEVGESDVSSEAVTREGDSLYLTAPIGPGEKQLSLQYHLPGALSTVTVPVGAAGGTLNVLLEDIGATVAGPGLAAADTQVVLGRTFRRWTGEVPAGALLRIELPRPGRAPSWVLAGLVGAVALALAVAAWRVRRGVPPAPAVAGAAPEALLEELAQLDARYDGREAEVPAGEWREYLERRRRLKAELESALAATGGAG